MRLRMKVSLIMAFMVLILITLLLYISHYLFSKQMQEQEKSGLQQSLSEVHLLIQDQIDAINKTTGDWALWDDTYQFSFDHNQRYIDDNLNIATLSNLEINLFAIVVNNEVKQLLMCDYKTQKFREVTAEISEAFNQYKPLFVVGNREITAGLISLDHKPYMISVRPITDSKLTAPKNGVLVMGKMVDSVALDKINRLVSGEVKVNEKAGSLQAITDVLTPKGMHFDGYNGNRLSAKYAIKDLLMDKSYQVTLSQDPALYSKGDGYFKYFSILCLFILLAVFLICMIVLQRFIVNPIEKIHAVITKVDGNLIPIDRFEIKGNDELTALSYELNTLLNKIAQNTTEIAASEKQLKFVLEAA
ncbi:MAG: hypothetical protein H7Y41_04215, partial [Hyphomonadaceae bacterium]|nr:hypothetical protein [Clostridia bacterium]